MQIWQSSGKLENAWSNGPGKPPQGSLRYGLTRGAGTKKALELHWGPLLKFLRASQPWGREFLGGKHVKNIRMRILWKTLILGVVTSVRGGVFVLAFWGSKSCRGGESRRLAFARHNSKACAHSASNVAAVGRQCAAAARTAGIQTQSPVAKAKTTTPRSHPSNRGRATNKAGALAKGGLWPT